MAKVGRNDPCPCGRGRKYKKCCMEADEQRRPAGVARGSDPLPAYRIAETEVDALSNSVIDLIEAGDFGAAEAACRRLQEEYPDQVDGIWRLASVHEARGDRAAAADCYRAAAEFARSHDGFEEQSITDMIEAAERMEAERAAPNGGPATPFGSSGVTDGSPSVP